MSDTYYTPKWERKPAPNTTPNVGTTDTQRTGDVAPLGYCPFSKHPFGSACALFNANIKCCGLLAALMNR